MKLIRNVLLFVLLAGLLTGSAIAQTDNYGTLDTVYADLARVDDFTWTITVSYTNDQPIEGLMIPLKMTAGLTRIVADSTIFTGGRCEHFTIKNAHPDTAVQTITLGLLANLGPTDHALPIGSGRLATIFVSSLDETPIKEFAVDTTTTPPSNSLMVVASRQVWGEHSLDTIPPAKRTELNIYPALVIRQSK